LAKSKNLVPKDKTFHLSGNTRLDSIGIKEKKTFDKSKPVTIEEEYISNLQQQI